MTIEISKGPEAEGNVFRGPATIVPHKFLQNVAMAPIPWGLSTLTFSLNASDEYPVAVWGEKDLIYLRSAITYTWVAGSNSILDSTGAVTTQTGSTLGVWYFYAYVDESTSPNSVKIIPSQTSPSGKDNTYGSGFWGHPGSAKTRPYTYVGFGICHDASTPGFIAFTKRGFKYDIPIASKLEQETADDTNFVALGFTGAEGLPTHPGVTVGGWVETAAGDTVEIASDSSGSGAILITAPTGDVSTMPFSEMALSSGDLYGRHGTSAGDVHITSITDVR